MARARTVRRCLSETGSQAPVRLKVEADLGG
jgi:hypothetical protein